MPLNISEQGVTWWMWHFRDIGLVGGLAHCTHLRGRDSKNSALTQNDSSHSQELVFKKITRWGYSKENEKFSCRVLYFKCCYYCFKSWIGEREQRLLPNSNSSVLGPIQVSGLRAWASPLVVLTWFPRVDQSLQSLITNEHLHLHLHLYVTFLIPEDTVIL